MVQIPESERVVRIPVGSFRRALARLLAEYDPERVAVANLLMEAALDDWTPDPPAGHGS